MKFKGLLLFFTLIVVSCGKEQDWLPYTYVNHYVSLQDPKYSHLKTGGSSVEISNVGVGGIIIYNNFGVYKAYDRRSPASKMQTCNVSLESSGTTALDNCTGTRYNLAIEGIVMKASEGMSGQPLKQYGVSLQSDGRLRIYN